MTEREICGVLPVNKPAGMTSHDIVFKIRKLYGTKKVGHTGTLDPDATGLLIVLIGRAAKAAEYVTAGKKVYRAGLRLGLTTDTEDTTGKTLTTCDDIPAKAEVLEAIASFKGESLQVPPMYSALKVNGQKLCDLARKGITVEREARPITVYSISAEGDGRDYTMEVACSAGTYIRTLCADIGAKLGCGGAMSSLFRTETGGFEVSSAHTLEEIEALTQDGRDALLIPTEKLFSELPEVKLPAFYERLAKNGAEIYQKKIGTCHPTGALLRVYGGTGFFGIGSVREYEGGSAIKIVKFL
ncbi:MAG: tRNA pseudouridine(55) synthase TruB [Clostridia bacterium]|nr:tRNA pseudouridine(55) synthase TruB [Clostridia bacterium]